VKEGKIYGTGEMKGEGEKRGRNAGRSI